MGRSIGIAALAFLLSASAVAQEEMAPAHEEAAPAGDARESTSTPHDEQDGSGAPQAVAPEKPWERGVTEEERHRALGLFRDGNALFARSEYSDAAARYREALEVWDHPRIHGNLATVLARLDDPLGALRHIELALRYGAEPFEAHIFEKLVDQRGSLLRQLAQVVVTMGSVDAEVTLDGEPVEVGSGGLLRRVTPGRHQLVARKDGHRTFTHQFTVVGGEEAEIEIELVPLHRFIRYEQRWPTWIPWGVVGLGAAIAAVGIPLRAAALSSRARYEQEIAAMCPLGCPVDSISSVVTDLARRARTLNALEIGAYALGGATVATGAVLLYINRRRPVEMVEPAHSMRISPRLSSQELGLSLEGRF